MSETQLNNKERAYLHLALQLDQAQASASIGVAPNDEELTALYENTLVDTRRAQILTHIANTNTVYQRWLRCVECQSLLAEQHTTVVSSDNNSNIFVRLIDFFSHKKLISGGLSTFTVAILVLIMLPSPGELNVQQSINDAYYSWGPLLQEEWQSLPAQKKPTPVYSSSRSLFSKPTQKTPAQQILLSGFRETVEVVGAIPFKDYGISLRILPTIEASEYLDFKTEQFQALVHTGQISALAALQCKLNSEHTRLTILANAMTQLYQPLATLKDQKLQSLVATMNSNSKINLCDIAQRIVVMIVE